MPKCTAFINQYDNNIDSSHNCLTVKQGKLNLDKKARVHQCSQFFGGKILVHKFQMFTLLQICTDSHPNPARYMKQNLVKCGVISISKKLPRPCQQTSRTVTCHNTQCWQVLFVISVSSMLIDRYATATALHHKHASIQFYSSGQKHPRLRFNCYKSSLCTLQVLLLYCKPSMELENKTKNQAILNYTCKKIIITVLTAYATD